MWVTFDTHILLFLHWMISPKSTLTGISNISDRLIRSWASGTERPFSHLDIVWMNMKIRAPNIVEYGISDVGLMLIMKELSLISFKKMGWRFIFLKQFHRKSIVTWLSDNGTTVLTLVGGESKEKFLRIIKNIEK